MSILQAEQLKRDWTDKHVVVMDGVPELRRFEGLLGQVKTVNMNCRLLVEFDAMADISWYDIAPEFVNVVDAKEFRSKTEAAAQADAARQSQPSKDKATQKTSSPPTGSGGSGSPLDKIRAQAAGKSSSTPAPGSSPLDKIRSQASAAASSKSAADSESNDSKAGGSPLDQIRSQVAGNTAAASEAGPSPLDKIRSQASAAASSKSAADSESNDSKAGGSPLDQIRSQAAGNTAAASAAGPSPLDKIRSQASATASSKSAADSESNDSKAGGSPLDKIRSQNSGGAKDDAPSSEQTATSAKPTGSPLDQIKSQASTTAAGLTSAVSPDSATAAVNAAISQHPAATPSTDKSDQPPQKAATTNPPSTTANDDRADLQQDSTNSDGMDGQLSMVQQIREQAAGTDGTPTAPLGLFDQVAAQASDRGPAMTSPDVSSDSVNRPTGGAEDPVKKTFRGKKVPKQDDLKIVEGIGPKIAELLNADGITTWKQLSQTDPARLKKVLEDAGPRFRMHIPDTWPRQAQLADDGEWQQLEAYQDHLDGGKEPGQS